MLTITTLVTIISTAVAVRGQTTASSNVPLNVAAIEAHFTQAGIVPSFLSSFSPMGSLNVTFPDVGAIRPGQLLQQDSVQEQPKLVFSPLDNTTSLNGKFTVAMVDAGPVGYDETQGQTRHWLVNSATAENGTVSTISSTVITKYAGPAPPDGDGSHRYVILLYGQPYTFKAPPGYNKTIGVSKFDFNSYVQTSGLGSLYAATYFDVRTGDSPAGLSSTAAVISSTLVPPSATQTSSSGGASNPSSSSRPSGAAQAGSTSPFGFVIAASLLALLL